MLSMPSSPLNIRQKKHLLILVAKTTDSPSRRPKKFRTRFPMHRGSGSLRQSCQSSEKVRSGVLQIILITCQIDRKKCFYLCKVNKKINGFIPSSLNSLSKAEHKDFLHKFVKKSFAATNNLLPQVFLPWHCLLYSIYTSLQWITLPLLVFITMGDVTNIPLL